MNVGHSYAVKCKPNMVAYKAHRQRKQLGMVYDWQQNGCNYTTIFKLGLKDY